MTGTFSAKRTAAAFADEAGVLRPGDLFVLGVLACDQPSACVAEIRGILDCHQFSRASFEWKVNDKRLVPVYEGLVEWFLGRNGVTYTAVVFSQFIAAPAVLDVISFLDDLAAAQSLPRLDALYNHLFLHSLAANPHLGDREFELHVERRSRVQTAGLISLLHKSDNRWRLTSAVAHGKSEGLLLLQFTDLLTSTLRRLMIEAHWPTLAVPLLSPSKIHAVRLMRDHVCNAMPEVRYMTFPALQPVSLGVSDQQGELNGPQILQKFNLRAFCPSDKQEP